MRELNAMIAGALTQGDFAKAERLAVTAGHWQMIRQAREETRQSKPQGPVINQFECERAMRNVTAAGSSLNPNKQSVAMAKREADIKCYGYDRSAEIEKARAGAPRITIYNEPQSSGASIITHCDTGFCYNDRGDAIPRVGR